MRWGWQAWVGLAVALICLYGAAAYPLATVVALASLGAWFIVRKYGFRAGWVALVPISGVASGFSFSWLALTCAESQKIMNGGKLSWNLMDPLAWITLRPASNVNLAGRYGLLAGTLFAFCAIAYGCWSGAIRAAQTPTRVHGLPVAWSPAKGTSRWADNKDVAHVCEFGPPGRGMYPGGIVLGKLQNRIVRVIPGKSSGGPGLAGHVAVFGTTGSGKSHSFVRPNIIAAVEAGESLVVTDPKGELCRDMANWLEHRGYEVMVFNLSDPSHSHRWNPVAECRDEEEVSGMARTLVKNAAEDNDQYFLRKETQLLEALVFLLNADFPKEYRHLRSALNLCTTWDRRDLDARVSRAYEEGRLPREGYERWRGAVSRNYDNAVSGLSAKLEVMCTAPIAALLSEHELNLTGIGKQKTALFCILPIAAEHLRPVLATFYWFLFRRLRQAAEENGGRLPVPVRLLMDEFANIGEVPEFPEIISTARSQGIMIQFVLQGLMQLDAIYGAARAENILANCPVKLLLGCNDMATARYFSGLLGEAAVRSVSERQDISRPMDALTSPRSIITTTRRKLMEPEELIRSLTHEAIAVVQSCLPLHLTKLGWDQLPQAREVEQAGQTSPTKLVSQKTMEVQVPESPSKRKRGSRRRVGTEPLSETSCATGQHRETTQ